MNPPFAQLPPEDQNALKVHAFSEGVEAAYKVGLALSDSGSHGLGEQQNPYEPGPCEGPLRAEWWRGWQDYQSAVEPLHEACLTLHSQMVIHGRVTAVPTVTYRPVPKETK